MQATVFAALLLSFVSSSFAYLVNVPNDHQGWSAYGPQTSLSWSRVNTDATSFAVFLTNQDRTVLLEDFLVANYIDGTRLTTKIYPGRGGFPTGSHFRVNLVKNANEIHTIYAQSNEFTIHN
ncbi:hypothetical protein AGABI1DRAFT_111820 [Agaricus bisporus var. burnettii JB137-S8]|uniref:Yeast cell wall synthesis Kre9/Knh1-like N-terminal domain-containing protein n=1 Tax=Agaricus bisporus var. burnettii (strain JB137-S8 / ATCC MYA-4627 / FGSC 10392) TaxID=597362 RepID=K5W3Z9_AGABU|nr:uncharacterized protein AGABI1DRAFT_111820 [Agaricus bisporus var. burnettii JB137-S8]EKM81519.1 hypothetical protein AGABI1DRAFT_111820 [Agaricus bisporus var. burnettii JB137-S8]